MSAALNKGRLPKRAFAHYRVFFSFCSLVAPTYPGGAFPTNSEGEGGEAVYLGRCNHILYATFLDLGIGLSFCDTAFQML